MFANDVSGKNLSTLIPGVPGGHHELSHHQNQADKHEPCAKTNRWHCDQLAHRLNRLAANPEGDRSLLENRMILFGSGMSDGNRHDPNNLPILLPGRDGGAIESRRYLASPRNPPQCNLRVSMLERIGTPVDAFGDSTAPPEIG